MSQAWIQGIGGRRATARLRLYVFPHAGGGAAGYRLDRFFPDDFEICQIQPPGREDRMGEEPLTSVAEVVDGLLPQLTPQLELPFAFLGHSMGALLAYETTRRLAARGAPVPRELFVSAYRAPHLPERDPVHHLPDEEFLRRMDLADAAVFEDPDLREMFLPALRADVRLCETYAYEPGEPLPCPVTALGGQSDPGVEEAELDAWRRHTAAAFTRHTFPGGHFYLHEAQGAVADHVVSKLTARV
jgi:medium-chain acyl-[acyl-carrier-protein] hydrolase